MTLNGGAIAHVSKRMHLIVDSSMESEAVATGKAGEIIGYAREILRALGVSQDGPTPIGTDNRANILVAGGSWQLIHEKTCTEQLLSRVVVTNQGEVLESNV